MSTGLEQGVMLLLGSKSSHALLQFVTHSDLILVCCSLIAGMHAMIPRTTPLAGRVCDIMHNVLLAISLNTLLLFAKIPHDTPLTCLNLLSVFYLAMVLIPNEHIADSAQFLLVSNLCEALTKEKTDTLALAWGIGFMQYAIPLTESMRGIAQLITVETFTIWLREWLPTGLLLPSALVLLYFCAPFIEEFPVLRRLFRFAIFAVSNDPQMRDTPTWVIATGLWVLWQVEVDPVSKTFAALAGAQLGVLVVLDATRFAMDNDPAPTLMGILVAVSIIEHASP
jgi:hypothetical protein